MPVGGNRMSDQRSNKYLNIVQDFKYRKSNIVNKKFRKLPALDITKSGGYEENPK